jgi:LytS/YehU family sensor histidine kinase
MAALEAWIYYAENRQSQFELNNMRHELAKIRFEVLKNQMNPHFLFNSLNVLSALVSSDAQKAGLFIEEFAQIYRYVLETIEKPLVTLEQELEFARSYMYLQQIRFGANLHYTVEVDSKWLKSLVPPLCLQVVLENAIKHNAITSQFPLLISIKVRDEYLLIENTIRHKVSGIPSTGVGQKNLMRRYELMSGSEPSFKVLNGIYLVRLPLIQPV